MTIGNIILDLRTEHGISQKKLADAIGISQAAIAKIEINRNEATAATIRKLADFFGVSADYLLGLENDYGAKVESPTTAPMGDKLTAEERELIEKYRELPADSRKLVLRMVGVPTERQATRKKA